MEFDQIFNLGEGILWMIIAAGLLHRSLGNPTFRTLLRISALAFLLFGVSDFIEIFTRAWYQPLGLFFLKAACVITLIACFAAFQRSTKK